MNTKNDNISIEKPKMVFAAPETHEIEFTTLEDAIRKAYDFLRKQSKLEAEIGLYLEDATADEAHHFENFKKELQKITQDFTVTDHDFGACRTQKCWLHIKVNTMIDYNGQGDGLTNSTYDYLKEKPAFALVLFCANGTHQFASQNSNDLICAEENGVFRYIKCPNYKDYSSKVK